MDVGARIAGYDYWHYPFDLKGHKTPVDPDRHRFRAEHFFDPLVRHYGGSLQGKRVLDLGCNAGFWSLKALDAGADHVLGIDGRGTNISQAKFVFEIKEVDQSRYRFATANLFDYRFAANERFDIVLCLSLLTHVSNPVGLVALAAEVNTDILVVDTRLSTARGAFLQLRCEDPSSTKDAVDYALGLTPTVQAVIDITRTFGYDTRVLGGPLEGKYEEGLWAAFVCSKSSLERSAFVFRDVADIDKRNAHG